MIQDVQSSQTLMLYPDLSLKSFTDRQGALTQGVDIRIDQDFPDNRDIFLKILDRLVGCSSAGDHSKTVDGDLGSGIFSPDRDDGRVFDLKFPAKF